MVSLSRAQPEDASGHRRTSVEFSAGRQKAGRRVSVRSVVPADGHAEPTTQRAHPTAPRAVALLKYNALQLHGRDSSARPLAVFCLFCSAGRKLESEGGILFTHTQSMRCLEAGWSVVDSEGQRAHACGSAIRARGP